MNLSIYHNPRCSKSRRTLEIIKEQGLEVKIIEYLKNPPDAQTLKQILACLNVSARNLLRQGERAYQEAGLDDQSLSEDQLIAAMVAHPILIERPIVVNNGQAIVGRPPENVLAIL